ncbi:MAG: gliding motility-associated C-terminal domain-containing protein [Bacteroidota bacterium]
MIKFFRAVRKVSFLFILILIFTGSRLPAQKEGAIWYFGQNAGLDFNQFYPKPRTDGQIKTREGVASICDKNGNLLFYTDGQTVYNRLHQIMEEGLFGDASSTQSSIIVPKPGSGDPTQYYIFTVDNVGESGNPGHGLKYSVVDMMGNNSMGSVVQRNISMMPLNDTTRFTEKITAVKSKDGTFYWIIAHQYTTWEFIEFKLTSSGIAGNGPFRSIGAGSAHRNTEPDDAVNRGATGYLKSSPKGDFLAVAVESLKSFELFQFNNENGNISFIGNLPAGSSENSTTPIWNAYGVEFSPTGNFLYGSARKGGVIYQWDISELNLDKIKNSVSFIREDNNVLCGALQLAFNGKIYASLSGKPYLGVINSPIQENCNYVEFGASLIDNEKVKGGMAMFGLPTFLPDFFKAAEFYYENTCFKDKTIFYISTRISVPDAPIWNVFDSLNNYLGSATVDQETWEGAFTFPSPGKYVVQMRATQFGSIIQPKREVTIQPLPELNFDDTTNMCKGSPAILDAKVGAFYFWYDNQSLNVERYRTITTPGPYKVTVTHYNGCSATDSTLVVEVPIPVIKKIDVNAAACGFNNGSITITMESDTSDYYFSWPAIPDNHTNTAKNLKGDIFEVEIISKTTGCQLLKKITVSETGSPIVSILPSETDTICPGTAVTLIASVTGQVLWQSPQTILNVSDSIITVIPLKTTTYIVKGFSIDSEGLECSAFAECTIEVFPYEEPDLGEPKSTCEGDTIKLDGGGNFREWLWSTNEISRFINVTKTIDSLYLWVTDRNGCHFADTTSVLIKKIPAIDLGEDRVICKGTPLTLDAGLADTYTWNTGDTTRYLDIDSTGIYVATISKDQCENTDFVRIRVNSPDSLRIESVMPADVTCFGAADGSIIIKVRGEGSFYEYSIDDGDTYYNNQGLFENLDGSTPYYIHVREDGVCEVKSDSAIEIHEPDPVEIDYRLVSPSCEQCDDGEITLTLTGGTPPYSVLWSTMDSTLRLRNIGLGTYPVWVKDSLKCSAYENIQMEMGFVTYSIPNAFTPNGDHVNELWEIAALKDKPNCVVQVFDRSGRKIFESEAGYPESDYWDGKDDTTGLPVPVGSYFYLIYVDKTTKAKPLTGTVTILR